MPQPRNRTTTLESLRDALADRYTIERELGAGGMATVYLAQDLKHHRKVAIKVLRPELSTALGGDRFPREIEIIAQLSHPHILPLHDSGESEGFLYYVMPFVQGETLRQRLEREGSLEIAEAVRILREVVDALAYAHQHSVVHRDIKPENIMLSGRHAIVMDFGVAKAVSSAGREKLTTVGLALGTPAYMAPEQATGETNLDHRADIYAVGVLAYEMLSGAPPFDKPTAQAILSAHVLETPVDLVGRRPGILPQLSALVMRCLEKEREDRWQSAEETPADAGNRGHSLGWDDSDHHASDSGPPAGAASGRWALASRHPRHHPGFGDGGHRLAGAQPESFLSHRADRRAPDHGPVGE